MKKCGTLLSLLVFFSSEAHSARIEPHQILVGEYKVLREAAANAKEKSWPWLAYEAFMSATFDGLMFIESSAQSPDARQSIAFCIPDSMRDDEMTSIYKRFEAETEIATENAKDTAVFVLVVASHFRSAFPCDTE